MTLLTQAIAFHGWKTIDTSSPRPICACQGGIIRDTGINFIDDDRGKEPNTKMTAVCCAQHSRNQSLEDACHIN